MRGMVVGEGGRSSGVLLYYNFIVGQTYIDSVPVPFYHLCCVTDADGYRPSCLLSTQLHVDDRVLSCAKGWRDRTVATRRG